MVAIAVVVVASDSADSAVLLPFVSASVVVSALASATVHSA